MLATRAGPSGQCEGQCKSDDTSVGAQSGSAIHNLLPAPAVERSLAATARPAEPQERFCQAALLIHVTRSESLLWGPQLAAVPTWSDHRCKGTLAPPAEVHCHDRQVLRPAQIVTVARIRARARHDDAWVPLPDDRRARSCCKRRSGGVRRREGDHDYAAKTVRARLSHERRQQAPRREHIGSQVVEATTVLAARLAPV
jgi:hypothetical protein